MTNIDSIERDEMEVLKCLEEISTELLLKVESEQYTIYNLIKMNYFNK